MIDPVAPRHVAPQPPVERDEKLWKAAQALEANFLTEMLKSAGVGEAREAFGGGIGEEQFASFMRDIYARDMTEAGGIGLAQSLYAALTERQNGS